MNSEKTTLNVIQHHSAEGPGAIAHWAQARGVSLTVFRAYLGELPPMSAEPVVLLGGPYESNAGPAWLEAERQWLAGILERGAPVFAICLGGAAAGVGSWREHPADGQPGNGLDHCHIH